MPSPEMKNEFTLCCQIINSLESVGMEGESTSAPWVILVINVNISLVGLIFLSSIFQMSSTVGGMDKRMWNPF